MQVHFPKKCLDYALANEFLVEELENMSHYYDMPGKDQNRVFAKVLKFIHQVVSGKPFRPSAYEFEKNLHNWRASIHAE
jgi:hypothetical protein